MGMGTQRDDSGVLRQSKGTTGEGGRFATEHAAEPAPMPRTYEVFDQGVTAEGLIDIGRKATGVYTSHGYLTDIDPDAVMALADALADAQQTIKDLIASAPVAGIQWGVSILGTPDMGLELFDNEAEALECAESDKMWASTSMRLVDTRTVYEPGSWGTPAAV
jgi:hypothetical protein